MGENRAAKRDPLVVPGAAFLLSQVGTHSSRRWGERLEALGLDPRHVAILRLVAAGEGSSQRALVEQMRLPASRMVGLVDALEEQGLVERRANPDDRRAHALFVTGEGRKMLRTVMRVSAEHEAALCAGLADREREQLIRLLSRIAAEQGLAPGVHPGLAAGRQRDEPQRSGRPATRRSHPG